MKIILAIFAIACTVAFFALRDGDVPPPQGDAPFPQATIASPAGAKAGDQSLLANKQASTATAEPSLAKADQSGGAGNELLRAARERLDRHLSVAALVRYQIVMFQSELIGTGMYQQAGQGSERRFRLELKTQLGDKLTSLLHVCDSETLWTYRERSTGTQSAQVERLDLRRVRAAQAESLEPPINSPVKELATGGLPKLIEGLRSSFRPLRAEAGYLGDQPMWAIELEWKPVVLAALLTDKQGHTDAQPGDLSKQPQIPERVMVYLGHEDLFPRRIEFLRRASSEMVENGPGQGRAGELVPAVSLEFTDVRFNEPIDPRQFEYMPASAVDVTEAFLRSRRLPIVR
jgi:hypothetical protein